MSDSLQTKKAGEEKSETKVQFKSDNIGRWASKQENPFAEQNRKSQAKKQKQAEQRKKSAPFVVAVVGVLAVAAGVCGLVFLVISLINSRPTLPDDLTLGSAGAEEIQDQAQAIYKEQIEKFYNQNQTGGTIESPSDQAKEDAANAVSDYFDNQKNIADTESAVIDLSIIEMQTYAYQGMPNKIIEVGESMNEEAMSDLQKRQVWGLLSDAYYSINDAERGDYYLELMLGDYEEDA